MKSFLLRLLLLLLSSNLVLAAETPRMDTPRAPQRLTPDEIPVPDPPRVAAKGYLLVAYDSGRILAESNADEPLEPASLTKIMTGYVVFRELASGNLSLEDRVLISEKAWRTGGSKTFVEVGTRVSVEDLLLGVIVQSGNDASVALAEHVAGSEETFAHLMNTHAKRLGMTSSSFVNSTGLPDENLYTTARDIALVTAATIREFPEYYTWYAQKKFTFNGIEQPNRNRLLWRDDSVDGVKTGHTQAAGYCLVASAERDGMRLISVVMGANGGEARAQAALALLNYGFRFYESPKLFAAGQEVENLRIWMGEVQELPVGPAEDVYVTVPRGKRGQLSVRLTEEPVVTAPIAKGAPIGHMSVLLDGDEIKRVSVVALRDVAEGGFLQKAKDSVLQWF